MGMGGTPIVTADGISTAPYQKGDNVLLEAVNVPDVDLANARAPLFWLEGSEPDLRDGSIYMGRVFNLINSKDKYKANFNKGDHFSIVAGSDCAMDSATLGLYSNQGIATQGYTFWDTLFTGLDYDNQYYDSSLPFVPGVNEPAAWPGKCGLPSQRNYQQLSENLLSVYPSADYLKSFNPFGFSGTPNFIMPPGTWPVWIAPATTEQIKATYAVSFFSKYLKKDSSYDVFLNPSYAKFFQPDLQRYEACSGPKCNTVYPSAGP